MTPFARLGSLFPLAAAVVMAGCIAPADEANQEYDEAFTSDVATLMDFEFDGELVSAQSTNPAGQIRGQMLYTVGQLNGDNSVARLANLALTGVTTTPTGGLYRIRYHAKVPVAWGSKTNLPTSYTVKIPKRVDDDSFFRAYAHTCNDGEDDSVLTTNFWFHYRPNAAGCALSAAAATSARATVSVSTRNTVSRYPEYQRVWEDNELSVLAVFGKYAVGGVPGDAGVDAYNEFIGALRAELPGATTTPANIPETPSSTPDITFKLALADGRSISVVALLVDLVSVDPPNAAFEKRYNDTVTGADLVIYSGHAGLGKNVRALANKGKFFPGKYQVFFMNGCDTEAYADTTLATRRAALNPDDPGGTKYMDMITNAMPAYFASMSNASMSLIRALRSPTAPKSYGTIFKAIDPAQVVVVTGEEDNTFSASYSWPRKWSATQSGAVEKGQTISYSTEVLPAGKYLFTMTPDVATVGGDADLHVRVGAEPTITSTYKCPSYQYNSNERCSAITLTTPSRIFYTATGDKAGVSSGFVIRAFAE